MSDNIRKCFKCFVCSNKMKFPLIERQENVVYWCFKCGSIEILDAGVSILRRVRELNKK